MKLLLLSIFLLLFSACETKHITKQNETNSFIDFHNSEVNCAHCSMAVSDKNYAAQLQLKDQRALFFDDIGCLLLWKKKNPSQKTTNEWIFSLDTQKWIKANHAFYQGGDTTPMEFGYGAYEKAPNPHISYAVLKERF